MLKTIQFRYQSTDRPGCGNHKLFIHSSVRLTRLFILLSVALLTGCDFLPEKQLTLESGTLTVLTRNIPTAYYIGPDGETGFEYDLARKFADDLGLKLKIKVANSISEIFAAMANDQADIAAGGLIHTRERERRFTFGPDYDTVRQQFVYRKGSPHPDNLKAMQDYLPIIPTRSSYAERLRELKLDHPELRWQTTDDYSTDQLLEKIWLKKIPCTIADSNILAVNRRYYPELKAAFPIYKEQSLAWIINPKLRSLHRKLNTWFKKIEGNGQLENLKKRYYTDSHNFDYVDTKVFIRRIKSRLPDYRHLFEKFALKYDIPWTLLAAKAYQESHWNPEATSVTGVRGIMMLTNITALQLGIDDRLNAEESIRGGARYLRQLLDRVPDSYPEADRRNVAMAAYNVGMGHIYDARKLARLLDKDPDNWSTLKEVLPLLKQKKYYEKLDYGYARGREPVIYVNRINNYRNILEKKVGLLDTNRAIGSILRPKLTDTVAEN